MYITYVSVCVHMYKKETGYKMIWYEYSICKCCPVLEGRLEPRIWRAENLGNCGTGGGTLRFVTSVIEGTCKGNPGLCFTTITVSGPPLMFGGSWIDWLIQGVIDLLIRWFRASLIQMLIDSVICWFIGQSVVHESFLFAFQQTFAHAFLHHTTSTLACFSISNTFP